MRVAQSDNPISYAPVAVPDKLRERDRNRKEKTDRQGAS